MKFLLSVALFLVTLSAPRAQQMAPVAPPVTASSLCCGAITPEGHRLEALIDSLDVEHLWLAHQHVNWETGQPDENADYEGPGRSTHCSAYAAALAEHLNIYMLRPPDHGQILLASAQARWFQDDKAVKDGWKEIQGKDHERWAQELANQGNLVVIAYESPDAHKPGHVVIVRPSEKSLDALHQDGPQITQAGTHNHASSIAARSFTGHPGAWPDGVRYYWHFVDWSATGRPDSVLKP